MKTRKNISPTKRLLVNADDLGLSPGINRGIIRTFREGIVRSASLIVNAPGFDDAVRHIGDNRGLSVGIHVTLVGGDGPVCDARRVTTLIDGKGRFPRSYFDFVARYFSIKQDEVRREVSAQIERALSAGVVLTHLDSHQHVHLLPKVADVVLEQAERYGIRYIRLPRGGGGVSRPAVEILSGCLKRELKKRSMESSDHFAGFTYSGRLTKNDLVAIIEGLGCGTTELMVHPGADAAEVASRYGWRMNWERELDALISSEAKGAIAAAGIELVGHPAHNPGNS
jgi:predicted glycoside hydrolase/deacetylase ChbG (UPF0249 family)